MRRLRVTLGVVIGAACLLGTTAAAPPAPAPVVEIDRCVAGVMSFCERFWSARGYGDIGQCFQDQIDICGTPTPPVPDYTCMAGSCWWS